MIFGKSKEQQKLTSPSYQWPEPNRKYQRLRIAIEKVRYSVSGSYGHWSLEFEGRTRAAHLKDLLFVASVELLDPFETPSRLKDEWAEVPESVEGTCQLQEIDPMIHPSQLNATLYCSLKGIEPIIHTLAVVGRPECAAVIDIEIDRPGNLEPDFWLHSWTTSELRVRTWRIICESS